MRSSVANLVNAVLNWILIFGHFGVPAMGVAGSAWATTMSRWLLALLLLFLVHRRISPYLWPIRPEIWEAAPLGRMIRLGLPIGCQYLLEFGAFALVALMMGWLGTNAMAGHQIAINLASLTFMVPLGPPMPRRFSSVRRWGDGIPQGPGAPRTRRCSAGRASWP